MDLCGLAKSAVEIYTKDGKIISPEFAVGEIPEEFLKTRAGVFVTIQKEGDLRGCIGTYLPVYDNIVQEVIHNAIAAAGQDCRFGPVVIEELPLLRYIVYILSKPAHVESLEELDPQKFGVIVKSGHARGLLLPGLEGVKTVEQQISIACQKAGIDPARDQISVEKFEVVKYNRPAA